MRYKDVDYKELDYLAYNLYKHACELACDSDERFQVLSIYQFVVYNFMLTEDNVRLSFYYDLAKIELRKEKLEKLQSYDL